MNAVRHSSKNSSPFEKLRLYLCLVFILLLALPGMAFPQDRIIIGTASSSGVYHIVGRVICRLVETPCNAQATEGSTANIEAIRRGALPIALAQSDIQYHAVNGTENFVHIGADPSLRALFSIHSEPFTLVVRRASGILNFDNMSQRSINIGNPGSGQRGTMMKLLNAKGWTLKDFSMVSDLSADQQSMELCHGNVEAMVYTVGHPNPSVEQAIRLCNAVIIDVEGPYIDKLISESPYYSRAWIAGGLYGEGQLAVRTFGVRATLVAAESTDQDMVYRVVAAVFDNLDRFKAYHPAFMTLNPETMIHEGLSAPLHEGALRYYRERGWIEGSNMAAARNEQHKVTMQADRIVD